MCWLSYGKCTFGCKVWLSGVEAWRCCEVLWWAIAQVEGADRSMLEILIKSFVWKGCFLFMFWCYVLYELDVRKCILLEVCLLIFKVVNARRFIPWSFALFFFLLPWVISELYFLVLISDLARIFFFLVLDSISCDLTRIFFWF